MSYQNDEGMFYSNIKSKNSKTPIYAFENMENEFLFFSDDLNTQRKKDNSISKIKIIYEKKFLIFFRSYMKIWELLVLIGGFINVILIMGNAIALYFIKFLKIHFLLNDIFDFSNTKYESLKIDLKRYHLFKIFLVFVAAVIKQIYKQKIITSQF